MKSLKIGRFVPQGAIAALLATMTLSGLASAHHPDKENQPVHQRIDVIGPLGNRLEPGYRRKYNRPRYWGGKIAYHIAPSSQEAMVWHRSVHAGAYEEPKKHCRLETHYFYPKPWQALTVGPRRSKSAPAPEPTPALEMLETEPLDLTEPESKTLPEPEDEPELELPEIQLQESVPSPSDTSGLNSRAFGVTAQASEVSSQFELHPTNEATIAHAVAGKHDASRVSRASRVGKKPELSVADKPVYLRLVR